MSLISLISEEIASDDCDQSKRLRTLYENATPAQREAIDDAFTCLCGWTLATLIAREERTDDEIESEQEVVSIGDPE